MKIVCMSIFNNYCKLNLELKQLTGCYLTVKTTEKHKRDLIGTIHVLKHYQKCYRQLKIVKRTLSNRLATERVCRLIIKVISNLCIKTTLINLCSRSEKSRQNAHFMIA